VKDFNTRFRSLYLKLYKKHKKPVSVLDYVDSLRNNEEAWKRLSLQNDISLKQAYNAAEKVDRLMINQTRLTNQENYRRSNYNSYNTFKRNSPSIPYKKKLESEDLKRTNVYVIITRKYLDRIPRNFEPIGISCGRIRLATNKDEYSESVIIRVPIRINNFTMTVNC